MFAKLSSLDSTTSAKIWQTTTYTGYKRTLCTLNLFFFDNFFDSLVAVGWTQRKEKKLC